MLAGFDLHFGFSETIATASLLAVGIGWYISLQRFRKAAEQQNRSIREAHYGELDRYYSEILAHVIAHPHLRSPKLLTDDPEALLGNYEPFEKGSEKRAQYDAYAQMVWCFIETIHDRCHACEDDEDRKALKETWTSAISAENRFHRGWFLSQMREDETHRAKNQDPQFGAGRPDFFCKGFQIFVLEKQWRESDWTYGKDFRRPPIYSESVTLTVEKLPRVEETHA